MEKIKDLINRLERINDFDRGFEGLIKFESISKEEMDMLIALFDESEYLKGKRSASNANGVVPKRNTTIDSYYLYFGNGKVLEISYEETEVDNKIDAWKESEFNALLYACDEPLKVRVNGFNAKFSITGQGDFEVFHSITPDGEDYQKYDGQDINDILVHVTVEDIKRRFYSFLEEKERGNTLK